MWHVARLTCRLTVAVEATSPWPAQNPKTPRDMKHHCITLIASVVLAGCGANDIAAPKTPAPSSVAQQPPKMPTLTEARQGFKSKLIPDGAEKDSIPDPPPRMFTLVKYQSPAGKLAAYLTPDPKDGKKHPAIIWITGGDCNSIDEGCWKEGPPSNDQSASAFRKAGIVMMFPSLRGGNDNPGTKEGFLGEVDDVLAAADFLGQAAVRRSRPHLPGRPQHRRHAGPAGGRVLRPLPGRLLVRPGGQRRRLWPPIHAVQHLQPARGRTALARPLAGFDQESRRSSSRGPISRTRTLDR